MANVSEQIQSKTNSAVNSAKGALVDKAQDLSGTFERSAHDLGNRLGTMAGDVKDVATDYLDTTCDYIKANPIQSVLIAAAAGAVVGSVFTMSRRS